MGDLPGRWGRWPAISPTRTTSGEVARATLPHPEPACCCTRTTDRSASGWSTSTRRPWWLNVLCTSATLERLKRLRSCRARTTAVFRSVGDLGLKARWLRVWRGRSSDLTRPHSWWRRNCSEEAQPALCVSAAPATRPPCPGCGWRRLLRPACCRRAASSRAAVARSVPERPAGIQRAFQIGVVDGPSTSRSPIYRSEHPDT